ncbi:hypothetical protein [Paenibacillus naphthalenovorans]|uniref:hypothetical protein n=1 Tax=Paenibacillus naphthalenovorans TaxID=162209 RepID=UPI0008881B4E|nr:hypothetical protein [Paenibacillus naphthalenovorans]SDH76880.1 hypothetical protein SAMN05421868_10144 [Paenibacillus naphthalenovorans]
MKKICTTRFDWNKITEKLDDFWEEKSFTWKKCLNPITNRIGFGIYFYKNITINLNRINKEILRFAEDSVALSQFNKTAFPRFISVADGIHAKMFTQLPNHVIEQITSLIQALPGYQLLQSATRPYGYQCELYYNQGKVFFGSLQIHFKKINHQE